MQEGHNQRATGHPPLDEIQAFVDVATAGSFSAAALNANLAHSSLSRKVLYLEQWLGVQLFHRTNSGVQLTDAGKRYFERFSEALDIIGSSVNTAPRFEMHRPVRISAVQGVVMSILLPLHEKLTREIAGLSIHYELGRALTDFSEGTDLAIRSGGGMWKGMRVAELFPARVQPIAGTVIAEQLGPNPPAERLLEFPLIHLVVDLAWRTWFERKGIAFAKRPQDHVFDDVIVALAAVRHGLGIGLSRERIDPLPDGEHVHYVADQRVTLNTGYFLVRPADRRLRLPAKRYAGGIMQSMGHGNAAIEAFIEE